MDDQSQTSTSVTRSKRSVWGHEANGLWRIPGRLLGVPAVLTILSVVAVGLRFPYAENIAPPPPKSGASEFPRAFWLYAAASALVGFGFADFPLIAYHYANAATVSPVMIPVFYAIAMGAAGAGSLVFGRWFDRRGLRILIPGIAIGIAVAPLVFLGGFWAALTGTLLWGVSLGVHDAIMNAAVARMVPERSRARAYGVFTAVYGIAWFAGSAVLGLLYDFSFVALTGVAVIAELAAFIPLLMAIRAVSSSSGR